MGAGDREAEIKEEKYVQNTNKLVEGVLDSENAPGAEEGVPEPASCT